MSTQTIQFAKYPMVDVDLFLPRIESALEGVDPDQVAVYVVDAAIELARRTSAIRREQCIDLIPCVESYRLDIPCAEVVEVMSAILINKDGCPAPLNQACPDSQVHIENDVIYVSPMDEHTCANYTLKVVVAIAPERESNQLDKVFYSEYMDAVTDHALSRLYLLSSSSWYSVGLSREHRALFMSSLETIKTMRLRKHKPLQARTRAKRIM